MPCHKSWPGSSIHECLIAISIRSVAGSPVTDAVEGVTTEAPRIPAQRRAGVGVNKPASQVIEINYRYVSNALRRCQAAEAGIVGHRVRVSTNQFGS